MISHWNKIGEKEMERHKRLSQITRFGSDITESIFDWTFDNRVMLFILDNTIGRIGNFIEKPAITRVNQNLEGFVSVSRAYYHAFKKHVCPGVVVVD
jgi:hypothetical protein